MTGTEANTDRAQAYCEPAPFQTLYHHELMVSSQLPSGYVITLPLEMKKWGPETCLELRAGDWQSWDLNPARRCQSLCILTFLCGDSQECAGKQVQVTGKTGMNR